jgi:hypothetical protein
VALIIRAASRRLSTATAALARSSARSAILPSISAAVSSSSAPSAPLGEPPRRRSRRPATGGWWRCSSSRARCLPRRQLLRLFCRQNVDDMEDEK